MVGEANLAIRKEGSFDPATDIMKRIPMKRVKSGRNGKNVKKNTRKKRVSRSMPRGSPPEPSDDFLKFLEKKSKKSGLFCCFAFLKFGCGA